MSDLLKLWLAARPHSVQLLAQQFPVGSIIEISNDEKYYIIGYTEENELVVSEFNPRTDYDDAIANKKFICARHVHREH